MAKIKNLSIYNKTPEQLRVLKEEYDMIGFATKLYDDRLVVFCLPPAKPVAKKDHKKTSEHKHTDGRRDQRPKLERISG